ncbi:hypothetical protein Ancab_038819 [Ancistrocladus abbreviatus]
MFSSIIPRQQAISTCSVMSSVSYLKKKAAVLYHYPCPDGAFAALAAHLYFSATASPALFFPNTVYDPIKPEQLPLDEIGDVYLLDFVGPAGFVRDILSRVERLFILDHHKSALEMLSSDASLAQNMVTVIDMDRSGATISYDYFKQKLNEQELNVPGNSVLGEFGRLRKLFQYVEDGDLWKWQLENSKAFSSGLKDLNMEYDFRVNPCIFDQLRSVDVESVISKGMASMSKKQNLIDEALKDSFGIALGGGEFGHCLAVNADSISELRSELGHQLACKSRSMMLRAIGAVVYRVPELGNDHVLKISLRSDGDDTAVISQRYGGGGHRNASSFMLNSAEFDSWKVTV